MPLSIQNVPFTKELPFFAFTVQLSLLIVLSSMLNSLNSLTDELIKMADLLSFVYYRKCSTKKLFLNISQY